MLGTFHEARVDGLPAAIPIAIYFALTECDPVVHLTLRIMHSPDNDESNDVQIFIMGIRVAGAEDHLQVMNHGVQLTGLFHKPGVYFVQLQHDSETLIERRFLVMTPEQPA